MFSRLAKSLINFYHLERHKNVENFSRKFQIFFQLFGYGGEMLLVVWEGWAGSITNSYSLSFHSLVLSVVKSSTLWSIDKWKNHKKAAQKFESWVRDPTVAAAKLWQRKNKSFQLFYFFCFFLFDLWLRSLKIVLGRKLFASFHILQSQWNIN